MLHSSRVWKVQDCTLNEAVDALHNRSMCCCFGMRVSREAKDNLAAASILLLNDSTGPDGIQEYAFVDEFLGLQLDSITVGWCDAEKIKSFIEQALCGEMNGWTNQVSPNLNHPVGSCQHCA